MMTEIGVLRGDKNMNKLHSKEWLKTKNHGLYSEDRRWEGVRGSCEKGLKGVCNTTRPFEQ
jgi:hypothetical protein